MNDWRKNTHPGDYTLVTQKNDYNVRIMGVLNYEYWQIYVGKDEPTSTSNLIGFKTWGIDFGSILTVLVTKYLNKKSPKAFYKLIHKLRKDSNHGCYNIDGMCLKLCKCGTTLEEKL